MGGRPKTQLNYSILMLPILFKSVDNIVNDHLYYPCWIQQIVVKKRLKLKNDGLLIKMKKTTNLQINKLYTFYFINKSY